jgi:hypothetical protein
MAEKANRATYGHRAQQAQYHLKEEPARNLAWSCIQD